MGCCGKFFKAIIYIICLPFVLILSLLGLVLWAFFGLLSCVCGCCAPCACAAEAAVGVLEYLVKAPFKMAMWVGDKAGE